MRLRQLLPAVIFMSLSAFGAQAQDAAAGKVVFSQQCSICHSPVAGRNQVGPSLFGIVGSTAGQVPGFRFSEANKKSGVVFTEANLDRYLTDPRKMIPGTIMTYNGLKDATKRANVIAYLATLH